MTAQRDLDHLAERPEPSDKPDTVTLGPGASEYGYTLQEIGNVRQAIGALSAKLDRVIGDAAKQGDKLDEIRHQITFVKGAAWVVIGIAAITSFFVVNKIHISFGDSPSPSAQAPVRAPR